MTNELTLEEAIADIERLKQDRKRLLAIKPTKIFVTSEGIAYMAGCYLENPAIENDWRRLKLPEDLIAHIKKAASVPR